MSNRTQETQLDQSQLETLTRALEFAERGYEDHAKTLDKCAALGGNNLIDARSATQLAEEYRVMISDCRKLRVLLNHADVWVQRDE